MDILEAARTYHDLEGARLFMEARVIDAIKAEYDRQAEAVVARLPLLIPRFEAGKAVTDADLAAALLDDAAWSAFVDGVVAELLGAVAEGGLAAGAAVMGTALGAGVEPSAAALTTLSQSLARVKGTDAFTRETLFDLIGAGVRAGDGRDVIARAIRAQYDEWSVWRTKLIAQTAAIPVFNQTAMESYAAGGATGTQWLTSIDGRERESHNKAHLQIAQLGQPFFVGGSAMRFPGDPNAPARETIGCRCAVAPVMGGQAALPPSIDGGADVIAMFSDRERARVDHAVRDLAIRTCYPPLRDQMGQLAAIDYLKDAFATSEGTVRRAIVQPK